MRKHPSTGKKMNQQSLFYSDVYAALKATVDAVGKKRVAGALRPNMELEKASTWLRDALNPNRRELLPPEDVVSILRIAQEAGVQDAMWYLASESGYTATPINPEQQVAELQKDFLQAAAKLQSIYDEIQKKSERLPRKGPVRAGSTQEERREVS